MKRTRMLILAGGRSEEHEVSITSARSVVKAVAQSSIEATVQVVTRQGRWLSLQDSDKALTVGYAKSGGEPPLQGSRIAQQYDVIFPLMHGPYGEDGTVQGMLELAFSHDCRVIVEQGVPDTRELEVAILGNEGAEASPVGEITFEAEFYDSNAKYIDGTALMHIPASIPAAVAGRVQQLALAAYALLDCAGLACINFLYQAKTDALYLNEVNTLPGFTPVSMFPTLWQVGGIEYSQLIQKLVALAFERHPAVLPDAGPSPAHLSP